MENCSTYLMPDANGNDGKYHGAIIMRADLGDCVDMPPSECRKAKVGDMSRGWNGMLENE